MVEDTPKTVGELLNLLYALIEGGIVDENESVRWFGILPELMDSKGQEVCYKVEQVQVRIATHGGVYLMPDYLVDEAEEYLDGNFDEDGFVLMTPEEALREAQDDDA